MWLRPIAVWLCNCAGLLAAAVVVPAIGYGNDVGALLLAGAILGLASFALRPLVILLTLPAIVLSLGVALLFVNALMLWVTSIVVPDFHVGGFWSTCAGALVVWIVNRILRPADRIDAARRATPTSNDR
jgi:putative membrane protein